MTSLSDKIKKELKKKKFVVGCPTLIRLKRKDGSDLIVDATRGTEVVKWKDILKVLRSIK